MNLPVRLVVYHLRASSPSLIGGVPMGRLARRVLSSLAPLFFLAAIILVVYRHFDGNHRVDGFLMGDVVVLCQLGLAGVLCGALRDTRPGPARGTVGREAAQLLARALDAMPDRPRENHRLRAVAGSDPSPTPSSTPAHRGSAPRSGA